jgi:esterase/lipase superfamily enzyme
MELVFVAIVLVGCSSTPKLMPTPNIYLEDGGYPESGVPPGLKSNRVDLLFVTDRKPETSAGGTLAYGTGRSASVGFGSVMVDIGSDLSWQQLVEMSETSARKTSPKIRVVSRTELGRFPPTPHAFLVVDGEPIEDPEVRNEYDRANIQLHQEIKRRMAQAGDNEVLIFVHGFKNSFDHAAVSLAELWHFIGRRGVPMLYSWPAAHKGMFGYFIDRESGEFTIYHLKNLIRSLASFPEVERINILAHSRGTDVVTTALRELIIEARAAGHSPRKLYTTDADKALKASQTLMSGTRFGRINATDLGEQEQAIFNVVKNVAFINVNDVRSFIGHGYYLSSPSASSDIIRVINSGSKPGDPERPLINQMLNFWDMPIDYPNSPD